MAALLMIKMVGFDFRLSLNWREVRRLIAVGSPIAAVGLCFGLFVTADRWVVLGYLGTTQLGYYSLTIIVGSAITLLPKVLAQQVYPRMAEAFGKTSDHQSLKKWIFRQVLSTAGVLTPAILFVFFLIPPLVRAFLPAYQPGITAVRIALLGFLFLPLAYAFGNFLNTVDKQMYYLAVILVAIPVEVALSIGLVSVGMGINGVAIGMAVTTILYSLALCLVGMKVLKSGRVATNIAG
jgi:O-antigen/teichoic acid export membrane protein